MTGSISLPLALLVLVGASVASFYVGSFVSPDVLRDFPNVVPDMPPIAMPKGKSAPDSRYTAQVFDRPVTSHDQLIEIYQNNRTKECILNDRGECTSTTWEPNDDGEIHHPVGQHLLIDLKNINPTFLASEERIAKAMLELVVYSGLTLLSYHCSRLDTGVSCIGVLLESHVAVHSQPSAGTVNLDLFTCGPGALVPHLPLIERLFAIPIADDPATLEADQKPFLKWSHKKRGFPLPGYGTDPRQIDLREYLLGSKRFEKHHLTTVQTPFQEIDIYDVMDYRRSDPKLREASTHQDGSYEAQHKELYQPERRVYLNSIMKSRDFGEAAYHEMLVHPGMFTHKNPKRVAIIGGGEGAVLREVLKHKTVESVVMIEIDSEVVTTAKQFLHDWNNCSMIEGSTASCFDDPRVELIHADATAWFIDRYTTDSASTGFDVILMDAVDPDSSREVSNILYDNKPFVTAMSKALGEDGIFVAQMGKSERANSAPEGMRADTSIATFVKHLSDSAFANLIDYTDGHGRLTNPLRYMVAFKNENSRSDWKRNEAETDLEILRRLRPSTNGASLLRYFDGPTFVGAQIPERIFEDLYCRRLPTPESCLIGGHGWDPEIKNFPLSDLEVRSSKLGDKVGRGVFSKTLIPKGSYLGLEAISKTILVPPIGYKLLYSTRGATNFDFLEVMALGFIEGYGWEHNFYGEPSAGVEPTILCFVNHGCDKSYNIGFETPYTEKTAQRGETYDSFSEFYDPASDRRIRDSDPHDFTLKDIEAGEELLDNYLAFADEADFEKHVEELAAMCEGELGKVMKYEMAKQ